MLTENKAGQGLRPGLLLVVELPGIEPALENALNSDNTGVNGGKVRQSTPKHLGERDSC